MRTALERSTNATLLSAAVAVTVFVTALGSSSVAELGRAGRPLRWVLLLALLLLAAAAAAGRPERLRAPRAPLAAASWLVALALVSALWSVQPRLTAERGASLALLLAAAGTAAWATAGVAAAGERLVAGVVAGAAAVSLAGLPLLVVDHAAAVRPASYGVPARYQGIGQSPNTVALLLALAVPLATWMALERHRALGLAALALFAGSLAASASRGGLVGALAGALIVLVLRDGRRLRRTALLCGAACVLFAAGVAAGRLSRPGPAPSSAPTRAAAPAPSPRLRYVDVERVFPLEDDVGRSLPGQPDVEGTRTLLGSSGRTGAWRYALGQVLQRPVAGFGFGTEDRVFVDRFANFESARPENSYIGLLLQLGAVGLASVAVLIGAVVVTGRRGLRGGGFGVAAAGALGAGLVVALVQSYLYSAGDIAALPFWLAAALTAVAGAAAPERA